MGKAFINNGSLAATFFIHARPQKFNCSAARLHSRLDAL
jgi:hypothetical protein